MTSKCLRRKFATTISARKYLEEQGKKTSHSTEKCRSCGGVHIKEK